MNGRRRFRPNRPAGDAGFLIWILGTKFNRGGDREKRSAKAEANSRPVVARFAQRLRAWRQYPQSGCHHGQVVRIDSQHAARVRHHAARPRRPQPHFSSALAVPADVASLRNYLPLIRSDASPRESRVLRSQPRIIAAQRVLDQVEDGGQPLRIFAGCQPGHQPVENQF